MNLNMTRFIDDRLQVKLGQNDLHMRTGAAVLKKKKARKTFYEYALFWSWILGFIYLLLLRPFFLHFSTNIIKKIVKFYSGYLNNFILFFYYHKNST